MPTKSDIKKEGIVLRLTPQKENDAMVNCIGPDGFFSFYARGISKITSKNGPSCQTMNLSSFVLSKGIQGGLTLKEASLEKSFIKDDSFDALSALSLISELTLKVVQPDEAENLYPWLLECLSSIKDGFSPYTAASIYFAHVLSFGGMSLNVDGCVGCGKKSDIVAISYEDGGFICKDCFDPSYMRKTDPRKLKIVRYVFRCGLSDISRVAFEKDEMLEFLRELGEYLDNLTGVKLKSLSVIR